MKRFKLNKSGFIFLGVLGIIFVIVVVIIPLLTWPISEYSFTTRSFKSLKALNLADAGAEIAIWEIVYDGATFNGWTTVDSNKKRLTINSFPNNIGQVVGDVTIEAYSDEPNHYLITSVGTVVFTPGSTVSKTVKVKVFPHALFNNGIFGNEAVTITGSSSVDSYDSSVAPYDPLDPGSGGDVGTNGILTLDGDGVVDGDIFVGPDGSVVGDIASHVTGEDYYSGIDTELEDVPFPNLFLTLPSAGNFLLTNGSFIIPTGDYRYESVAVEGKGSLVLSEDTRLYIHNDFSIAGKATVLTNAGAEIFIGGNGTFAGNGIVNTTGIPGNLIIYGVNDSTSLNFTGTNDFYGTVYAPESTIVMSGDAQYYGAAIGNDVQLLGGIEFHFDENLLQTGPMVGYDIAYWQED